MLDGDKLSNKYKIEPYQYRSISGTVGDEMETRIKTEKISNVSKYIFRIEILQQQIEHLFTMRDEPEDEGFVNSVKELIKKVENWKVPVKFVEN